MSGTADPLGHHDWHSDEYVDAWIDRISAQERRPVLGRLVAAVAASADAELLVLDVGSGSGALAALVLEAFPRARVVCHDFSEPMLARAQDALASHADRVRFHRGDLSDPSWADALEPGFDVVVSSQAIHNVRWPERIREVYAELATLLRRDGTLLNLEIFDSPGPRAVRAYDQLRPGAGGSRRGRSDIGPISLARHLTWLAEAGFAEVDCLWKDLRQGLVGAFGAAGQ